MDRSHAHQEATEQVGASSAPTVEMPAPAAPVPVPPSALVVGHAEDAAEAEADRMADTALRRLSAAGDEHRHGPSCEHLRRSPGAGSSGAVVGREGGSLDGDTTATIEAERGGGRPLDAPLLQRMQSAFSASFSGVRIHDDAGSARLNRLVGARAFTTGKDVFFGAGEYAPATPAGERVLAHELAHTLQAPGSPVQRTTMPASAGTIRRMRVPVENEKVPSSYLLSGKQAQEGYEAWARGQWDKSVTSARKIATDLKAMVKTRKELPELELGAVQPGEFALPEGAADNWDVTVSGPSGGALKRVTLHYEHKTLHYTQDKKVGYKSTIVSRNGKEELKADANYAPTAQQKESEAEDKLLAMRLNQVWELQLAHYRQLVPATLPLEDVAPAPRELGKITRSNVENGQSHATVWLCSSYPDLVQLTDDDVLALLGTPNGYGVLHYVMQSPEFTQSNRLRGLDDGLPDAEFLRSIVDVRIDKFGMNQFDLIQTLRV